MGHGTERASDLLATYCTVNPDSVCWFPSLGVLTEIVGASEGARQTHVTSSRERHRTELLEAPVAHSPHDFSLFRYEYRTCPSVLMRTANENDILPVPQMKKLAIFVLYTAANDVARGPRRCSGRSSPENTTSRVRFGTTSSRELRTWSAACWCSTLKAGIQRNR